MAHDSINLCSNCRNPLSFKPRVDVDLRLDPSISRSLEIQEMISLCNEDLDDYDAQIFRLQNEILHLQARKKRLRDYKTLVQSSLSLFRTLPNEILCTVFESTCAENLLQVYPWSPSTEEEPITHFYRPAITYLPALAISAVCTRWRSLALASPRLWSHLRLETGRTGKKTLGDGFISTLQLYLERSVDAPLSINVVTQGTIPLHQTRTSHVLKPLLDCTNRWRTFSYTGDYEVEDLIGLDHSYPILENLTLEGDKYLLTRVSEAFDCAPKLLTVATTVVDLPRSWNHLTSFQILESPSEDDIYLLNRYHNLTKLKILSPWEGFGTGIKSLTKLQSFTFVECLNEQKANLLSDMFSSMTFPSLTELIIDSNNVQPRLNWPSDAFGAFISRSSCVLTTLSLRFVWISDICLIIAFRILPSLLEFTIDDFLDPDPRTGTPITPHFISCMSGSSLTPVLPKLRFLSITAHYTSFDDVAFVNMVSSRWLPGSSAAAIGIDCLRSLVLHLPRREVDEEAYRPLEILDRMGMQVVITGKRMTDPNAS